VYVLVLFLGLPRTVRRSRVVWLDYSREDGSWYLPGDQLPMRSAAAHSPAAPQLGLYKIFVFVHFNAFVNDVHFNAFVNEPIIIILPPPPLHAHTIPLQCSIARLPRKVRLSPDPPFICYTPYHIGSGNLL